ncbi:MAG: alpha/beta hydrolase family protein [Hyphomicrobium sp.]
MTCSSSKSVRPTSIASAALALAVSGLVWSGAAVAIGQKSYVDALPAEARSAEFCERRPNRIFVKVGKTSECISYFVTAGNESNRHAVMFLDGDISLEKFQDQAALARGAAGKRAFMQRWADKFGTRYVDIARVGVHGSSGNHGKRRLPHETLIMNEAVSRLKVRLGLDTMTLAGQSGGSTIAASLLTFGRTDVTCAVLGSGAYEIVDLDHAFRKSKGDRTPREILATVIYDPSTKVSGIARNAKRRIFVLGDEADSRTPFDQQLRFTNKVREAGHHARLLPIDARGETDHDAARLTIPVAGACARGDSDEQINRGIPRPKAKVASAETGKSTR